MPFNIIVKTITGKQMPIAIEDETTVGEIKAILEKDHTIPAATCKLIAYGKVLEPETKKASEFDLAEGKFLVAMTQKAKPAPKPKPAEEAKAEDPVPGVSSAPATTAATTAATQPPAQSSSAAATSSAATGSGAGAASGGAPQIPPAMESAVNELMSISGQSRELCIRALAAAQNVPDLAFEILMSGALPDAEAAGDDGYGEEDAMEDPGAGGDPFAGFNLDADVRQHIQQLVSNPNFNMIRQRLLTDPNFSQQFMQTLQQNQPRIFQAIQANPQILMAIIMGHNPLQGMGPGGAGGMPGAGAGAMGGMPAGAGGQPPAGTIQVSPAEAEAIDRLSSFGFSRIRAAEAYFACDKNEEMAANFLFEAGAEDEDVATQQAIAASQAMADQPPAAIPQPVADAQQPEAAAADNAGAGAAQQNNNDQPAANDGAANNDGGADGASGAGGANAGGDAGAAGGGSSLL